MITCAATIEVLLCRTYVLSLKWSTCIFQLHINILYSLHTHQHFVQLVYAPINKQDIVTSFII